MLEKFKVPVWENLTKCFFEAKVKEVPAEISADLYRTRHAESMVPSATSESIGNLEFLEICRKFFQFSRKMSAGSKVEEREW